MKAYRLRSLLALLLLLVGCFEAFRTMNSGGGENLRHHERPTNLVGSLEGLELQNRAPMRVKDLTPRPPELIRDYHFINDDLRIDSVAQAFDLWDMELLLVDFFTYSCTRCIRTVPQIRLLYETFRDKGLRVLAFARPEFDFEANVSNLEAWRARNSIDYPVATDFNSTNWNAWGVIDWPTHFLVRRDRRIAGKFVVEYTHVGDHHHEILWNVIANHLGAQDVIGPVLGEPLPFPRDVELFLGKAHQSQNHHTFALPLPLVDRYVIYGAKWCPFSRRAKFSLQLVGAPFDYFDVDLHGGRDVVVGTLQKLALVPMTHSTLPIIFDTSSNFIGGYSDLLKMIPGIDDAFASTQAEISLVEYYKGSSKVNVSVPGSRFWDLDAEAFTARVAGANLTLQVELQDAGWGFAMYAVCNPGAEANGWVEVMPHCPNCVAAKIDIRYPGRHYLGNSTAPRATVELRASLGMRLYVLWLTTEPYDDKTIA